MMTMHLQRMGRIHHPQTNQECLMKMQLLSATLALAFAASAQTAATPPASQPDAAAKASATTLPYSSACDGYFVKNTYKIPASKVGCLWLNSQAEFDQVFQLAPPMMYSKPNKPISMAGAVAFAVVYEGSTIPQFKMIGVRVNNGVVEVAYKMSRPTPTKQDTAVYSMPLIVVVNKSALDKAGGAKSVRFIENGKEAGTAPAPGNK
jgi:hypothetical protein